MFGAPNVWLLYSLEGLVRRPQSSQFIRRDGRKLLSGQLDQLKPLEWLAMQIGQRIGQRSLWEAVPIGWW